MATRGRPVSGTAHEGFLRYRNFRWAKVAGGLAAATLLVYLLVDIQPRHNGGSWLGYTLGTIGLLLILWLALLGVRKRAITRGGWSLKAWTSAHVYLGLALIVVGTLHSGFQFGWNVHTLAWALMMLVIASGAYGMAAYAVLPKALSDSRAEMTEPQMVEAVGALDRQIQAAAQPLGDAESRIVLGAVSDDPFGGGLLARLTGRYPRCANARALAALAGGGADGAALDEVRGLLERRGAALDRIRAYLRRRTMLEVWLFVHVPLTFALIAALIAHVVRVFFYW